MSMLECLEKSINERSDGEAAKSLHKVGLSACVLIFFNVLWPFLCVWLTVYLGKHGFEGAKWSSFAGKYNTETCCSDSAWTPERLWAEHTRGAASEAVAVGTSGAVEDPSGRTFNFDLFYFFKHLPKHLIDKWDDVSLLTNVIYWFICWKNHSYIYLFTTIMIK